MAPTAPVSVANLLVRVASGDHAAFRVLYAEAGPRMFAITLRMMKARDRADDVFQEALTMVWERSWQFDPGRGEALAWLSTLTRHCALDRLRRTRRPAVDLDEAALTEPMALTVLPATDTSGLQRCLASLRQDYRAASGEWTEVSPGLRIKVLNQIDSLGRHTYLGTGASLCIRPSALRSRHRALGILELMVLMLSATSLGATAPGMTETTDGWVSGKRNAA